ncbi:MAG TPA: hypothetical protein VF988_14705, partial [Verrucomicrobiae bacterium]
IEIPPSHWKTFCEKLNAKGNTLMDIRVQAEGDLRLVAQATPLHAVTFYDSVDACTSSLVIEFGPPKERPFQFSIVEPIRFILRREMQGEHYHLLEMPAESGTTVIIFHPGISPALIKDLELPASAAPVT